LATNNEKSDWVSKSATSTYISWCGYAFENICIKHIVQIKKALEIAGIKSNERLWHKPGNSTEEGAQMDLFARPSMIITYGITKSIYDTGLVHNEVTMDALFCDIEMGKNL